MRCLVLGHSGTAGFGLQSPAQTWPAVLGNLLTGSGDEAWIVSAIPLFPVGDRAVDYAIRRVQEIEPDMVVLPLNAYPCAVPVVSASVRHRFGTRAERLYMRLERAVEQGLGKRDGGKGAALRTVGQRWARLVLGTQAMTTVEEVGRVYREILRRLARLEGVQVVVLAEAPFGDSVRRRSRGLSGMVRELHGLVRHTAEDHRFLWCDAGQWLVQDSGDSYWNPDDVHLSERGNARYGEMLAASLRSRLGSGE